MVAPGRRQRCRPPRRRGRGGCGSAPGRRGRRGPCPSDREARDHVVDREGGPALDQGRSRRVEQVAGRDRRHPARQGVDGDDAVVVAVDRWGGVAVRSASAIGCSVPSDPRPAPRSSTADRRRSRAGHRAGSVERYPPGWMGPDRPWIGSIGRSVRAEPTEEREPWPIEVTDATADVNAVRLRGRVSGAPERRVLPSGDEVVALRVVVRRADGRDRRRARRQRRARARRPVADRARARWAGAMLATAERLAGGRPRRGGRRAASALVGRRRDPAITARGPGDRRCPPPPSEEPTHAASR